MYTNVRSRIKFNNKISADEFLCPLGVRQGESLFSFLFSMYLNDIEEHFILNDFKGIVLGMFKLFLLLYADNIVFLAESERGLILLEEYCVKY